MNERNEQGSSGRPCLLDYLIVIVKGKNLVAGTALAVVVLAAAAVLLMPSVYLAESRILPPDMDSSSSAAQLLSQAGGLSLPGGGLLGKRSLNDLYIGLLQSRTVLDRVVTRFGLNDLYRVRYRDEARKRLLSVLRVENDKKSGIIRIGVEDRDPKRAAEMANAFVDELKQLALEMAVTEASQRRLFYEEKLREAKESLIRSEEAMKGYQERTGAIEMKEQARAIIESAAKLRAQIVSSEVRLKVLRTYSTPQNPDLQKTEEELKGMKEQLARMTVKSGSDPDRLFSAGSVPEAGTGYIRKMRDLKYNEALFELLTKQSEMAKMDESRNSAAIQVIDTAVPPERRERPKRTRVIALAMLAGLFAGVLASFARERGEALRNDPNHRARLETLKRYALSGLRAR